MNNVAPSASSPRYAIFDAVRGFAILLMFVYHFSWDLTYFRFADFGIATDPYWVWLARFIAGLILLVMGIGQTISFRRGFRLKKSLKRLAVISSCAAMISLATYQLDPATFIFFGILHHITLATVLLTFGLYLPTLPLTALALACLIAPQLFVHEIFSAPWLWWTGLSPGTPMTIDYVPLLPWLGVSLLGAILGRAIVANTSSLKILKWQPQHPLSHLVYLAGHHSLLLYMIHQPILFGGVYLAYSLTSG